MSKLKEYLCIEAKTIEREDFLCYRFTSATKAAPEACMEPVYLKSEADKVIEKKDKEIADLIENDMRLAYKDIIMTSEAIKEVYKELYYSKYKRCLAMAKICENKLGTVVKPGWWDKWRQRWLELAEQFKEVK